jgi:16S rRNA (uracil1498-N3)-methyltransferase
VTTRARFFAPDLDLEQGETLLPRDEAHHLVRVMRLGIGDEVAVFDGRGHEFRARVVRATRNAVSLTLLEAIPSPPESSMPTMLIQAVLKGDKMDGVIRDATMAGVTRIAPIVTERTVVSLSSLARGHAHDRWQRVAVASAKQCRRARLPVIEEPRQFADWLAAPFDGLRLLLSEPARRGENVRSMRDALAGSTPPAIACIVGPEGGWSAAEHDAATSAGCIAVALGHMTLRADAVGLVALSVVNFACDP